MGGWKGGEGFRGITGIESVESVRLQCLGAGEEDGIEQLRREISRSGPCGISEETSELHRVKLPIHNPRAFPLFRLQVALYQYTGVFNAPELYMWRSNVLRLRNCSSTATTRNGLNARRYSSGRSLPVSEKEFEDALRRVLPGKWNTESRTPLGMLHILAEWTVE